MDKTFIKNLNITPPEEGVQGVIVSNEQPINIPEPGKFINPKTLKRLGRVTILLLSILFIIYAPIILNNYIDINKLVMVGENEPPLFMWFVSLLVLIFCFVILVLFFLVGVLIYHGMIKPIIKWIME